LAAGTTGYEKLMTLILSWEQKARRKFKSAELEKDPMGIRLIEHGAMTYYNCAYQLREILSCPLPDPSATPKEGQK